VGVIKIGESREDVPDPRDPDEELSEEEQDEADRHDAFSWLRPHNRIKEWL